jgi:long-subunit acyl-CoA synthetase (AMP-forming)
MEITKRDLLENIKLYEVQVNENIVEIHTPNLNSNYWYNITSRETSDGRRQFLLDDDSLDYDILLKFEDFAAIQKKEIKNVVKANTAHDAINVSRELKNMKKGLTSPEAVEQVKREVLEKTAFEWDVNPTTKKSVPALQVDMCTFFERIEMQHRRSIEEEDMTTTAYLEQMETELEAYKKCYGTEDALVRLANYAYKQWMLLQMNAEETRCKKYVKFLNK